MGFAFDAYADPRKQSTKAGALQSIYIWQLDVHKSRGMSIKPHPS